MSEIPGRSIAQRLQDLKEVLGALLLAYEQDPEKLFTVYKAYQVVNLMQTMAPEVVDRQLLSTLEEFVQAKNTSHADAPAGVVTLNVQGASHFQRFQRSGDLHDLERAITSWQRAVDLTPDDHDSLPINLSNLGAALMTRFERVGSLADLDAGISRIRKAVTLTPDGHSDQPDYINNLGNALEARFDRHGSLADLDDAILQKRKAVNLTADGHGAKPTYLSNLGNVLETRFRRNGSLADLEDAILYQRMAVKLTRDSHPRKPGYLSNLGNSLHTRFDRRGSLADLEDAIVQKRKAADLTPDGDQSKPKYLSSLGATLEARFYRHGALADLEDAILQEREAVDLTPDDHSAKPGRLINLGSALGARFDRHGSVADLEDAIVQQRKALSLTPDDHPNKPVYLNNLGGTLRRRFGRQGLLADLEESILHQRKAVNLTPDGHVAKPGYLGGLGIALQTRFDRQGSATDLEDAISQVQKAIDLTPDGRPGMHTYLFTLGSITMRKYLRTKALPDLEESILYTQKSADLLSNGHPNRTTCLNSLSSLLGIRFKRLGDPKDLQDALFAAQESAETPGASYTLRLQGAELWAGHCITGSTSSLQAFRLVIEILPRMAWLGLAVDDQYYLLAEAGSAVRNAVAAAISEKEYATAIEWAEQGRSIVWQNLLGLRTPLEDLQGRYPELAMRLQGLSQHLERSTETSDTPDGPMTRDTTSDRIVLAMERDNIIDEVRKKPGFESFMKPKSLEALAPASRDGPVVFLNLGEARCDALALLSEENGTTQVLPIPLERVTLQKAEQLSKKLVTLLSKSGVRARDSRKHRSNGAFDNKDAVFKGILKTLWVDYVQPIIDGLNYKVNIDSPPRLWWCTTGPLAFLPLHAAGLYDTEDIGNKLSDYVVSSYTPTLAALLDEPSLVSSEEIKVLTVAVSNTSGAPLPCTEEEVLNLQRLAANLPVVALTNEHATQERVLKELEGSTWAHLACHGEQVGGKPMESGLILHDGKLKLSEIVKARLPNAEFAFLSACQTAVGDGGVPEESAHLAAGMLFAGYRGVVATMWSIQDDIAPRVSDDFYRYLFRRGQPKREEAAYALHRAVRSLQESKVPFTSWVPFIHIGR